MSEENTMPAIFKQKYLLEISDIGKTVVMLMNLPVGELVSVSRVVIGNLTSD